MSGEEGALGAEILKFLLHCSRGKRALGAEILKFLLHCSGGIPGTPGAAESGFGGILARTGGRAWGKMHSRDGQPLNEYGCGEVHTQSLANFWSLLKVLSCFACWASLRGVVLP